MNKNDIIRIAQEAGLHLATDVKWMPIIGLEYAEKFAALVEENKRKAYMQLFTDPENQPTQFGTVTVEYMQREIEEEREACAKVADRYIGTDLLAADIRARGGNK